MLIDIFFFEGKLYRYFTHQQQCQDHSWLSAPALCPGDEPPSWGRSERCPWGPVEPSGTCGSPSHWWQSSRDRHHRCPAHCPGQSHPYKYLHDHRLVYKGRIKGARDKEWVRVTQSLLLCWRIHDKAQFVEFCYFWVDLVMTRRNWQKQCLLTIRINLVRIECQPAVVLLIWNAVIVVIVVTGISLAVFVVVGLVGIGNVRAVVQVILVTILVNVFVAVAFVPHAIWVRISLWEEGREINAIERTIGLQTCPLFSLAGDYFIHFLYSWGDSFLVNKKRHHKCLVWDLEEAYLVRVVFKRAVVTVVTNSISVTVSLVNIVHVGAVVLLVQDTCRAAPAKTC